MTISILPIRRDINFPLRSERITDWHGAGMNMSQFLNTMSLFFPVGERFFIDSVRHFRDYAKDDPELNKQITAFIGQEAMHGREHDILNAMLDDAGMPARAQEELVTKLLGRIQRTAPKHLQLAATVALEHLTAILGDSLLRNREIFLEGSDPGYAALWQWHALEETEHKAVAFDLYSKVMGRTLYAYTVRAITLPVATGIFLALLYPFYVENVRRAGGLTDIKGWWRGFQNQWGRPGLIRQVVKPWLDWFKPGFHPWDHDNQHFLQQVDEVLGDAVDYTRTEKAKRKSNTRQHKQTSSQPA